MITIQLNWWFVVCVAFTIVLKLGLEEFAEVVLHKFNTKLRWDLLILIGACVYLVGLFVGKVLWPAPLFWKLIILPLGSVLFLAVIAIYTRVKHPPESKLGRAVGK